MTLGEKSVAVVHPRMGFGGSEAVAMWALEALKGDHRVALVTSNTIDLAALNSYYGTSVGPDEVKVRTVPMPRVLTKLRGAAALRGSIFQRGLRRLASEYDVVFSAYNFCDCGFPAIHLLDLSWDVETRHRFVPPPRGVEGLFHRVASVRAAYLWLNRKFANPSGRNLFSKGERLLANSQWVARTIEERHGIRCGVLYPPVPGELCDTPLEERANEFVCLGRISEEKRIERMVAILSRVRARGHDVKLRIVGGFGADMYARGIRSLIDGLPWIVAEGSISDARKLEVLRGSRYAIHGAEGEAFGIAVAEMVRAGCIPFASAVGGPAEILDHPSLLYRGENEAVDKICAVLERERMRAELCAHLSRQAEKFTAERFMDGIRAAVADLLGARNAEDRAAAS